MQLPAVEKRRAASIGAAGPMEALERFLGHASVRDGFRAGDGGGHGEPTFYLVLEGGPMAVMKPGATDVSQEKAKAEVAAYRIARMFGFRDLVAPTVLRAMRHPDSGERMWACVQAAWAHAEKDVAWDGVVPDADVWEAALFDAIIGSTDRSHGWMVLKTRPPRLRLFDQGNGLGPDTSPPGSVFYDKKRGTDLPRPLLARLVEGFERLPADLGNLLNQVRLEGVALRVERLIEAEKLSLP